MPPSRSWSESSSSEDSRAPLARAVGFGRPVSGPTSYLAKSDTVQRAKEHIARAVPLVFRADDTRTPRIDVRAAVWRSYVIGEASCACVAARSCPPIPTTRTLRRFFFAVAEQWLESCVSPPADSSRCHRFCGRSSSTFTCFSDFDLYVFRLLECSAETRSSSEDSTVLRSFILERLSSVRFRFPLFNDLLLSSELALVIPSSYPRLDSHMQRLGLSITNTQYVPRKRPHEHVNFGIIHITR